MAGWVYSVWIGCRSEYRVRSGCSVASFVLANTVQCVVIPQAVGDGVAGEEAAGTGEAGVGPKCSSSKQGVLERHQEERERTEVKSKKEQV